MSQFTSSSNSSGSFHAVTGTRYSSNDVTKSNMSMTSTYQRDDESVVSELPESPTLPPEGSRGEDYTDISRIPATDHPRSPRDYSLASASGIARGPMVYGSSSSSSSSSTAGGMPLNPIQYTDFSQNLSSSASYPHLGNGGTTMERARSAHSIPSSSASATASGHHQSSSRANKHSTLRHVSSHSALNSRRSKRSMNMSDHMAAAIELSASPIVQPSPAAGMYWSRSVTYGRGPSRPLRAHTINLIGEQLFVFGGCDIKTCFNSLYILDMDTMTWSKPRTTGQPPPPCRAHSSTLVERDLGSGKRAHYLYVFGGGDGPNYFNDLYVLNADTLTWTKPNTEGVPPSPRRAHTTCLWNDKIVVVGGGDGARALSDVHILDISDMSRPRWSQLNPAGTPPIARGYHTSNLVKDKLIVFGGSDGHECFGDVHVLDLVSNRWFQVELDRVVPRLAHSATQVGSYVFVIGGHDGSRYSNDVLLLNLVTMSWETRRIYGGAPSPRGYHAAVLHDSRLYVLGGYDGKTVFDDVYMLELSACAYLPQITNFEIDL